MVGSVEGEVKKEEKSGKPTYDSLHETPTKEGSRIEDGLGRRDSVNIDVWVVRESTKTPNKYDKRGGLYGGDGMEEGLGWFRDEWKVLDDLVEDGNLQRLNLQVGIRTTPRVWTL